MGSKARERELERCIDSVLEEMNGMYCADLNENAKVDARMSDIKFRDELICQMKEAIRCKKISERMMAEQNRQIMYRIGLEVDGSGMRYSVARSESRP